MTDRRRPIVLTLTVLAVLALALMAAGLNEATFGSGSGFWFGSEEAGEKAVSMLDGSPGASPLTPYIGLIGTILVVLLPFGIILYFIKPELRKRVTSLFVQGMVFVMFAIFLSFISDEIKESGALLDAADSEPAAAAGEAVEGEPLEPIVSGGESVPDWLVAAASAVAAGALLVLGRRLQKRFMKPNRLEQLGQDAEEALRSIRRGADLRDTIRRCYFEMSQTLREEHSLQRNQAMTAREFELLLEESGLPRVQVQQLTRLFEGVRYGAKSPSEAEERLAVDCLSSIVQAAAAGSAA